MALSSGRNALIGIILLDAEEPKTCFNRHNVTSSYHSISQEKLIDSSGGRWN